ncbi:hypothetical protein FHW69_000548 [Luteibacter sp. Sphag1AF]|uniref:hypothetical protein n=1 Tax=Luteibacter sp. Sphag1AF TaxID=2587031 RepID=UPI00161A9C7B|nr:hypothetical protein [Luteibacter sp. Sphag1AF]MBB3225958.1 hypothetical protein [Luteibacter sp. Sphag1AF]
MPDDRYSPGSPQSRSNGASLTFSGYSFGAHCFNTNGCKVIYSNRYQWMDEDGTISPPPNDNYLSRLRSSHVGIEEFSEPAHVTWRSLDGTRHEASIDLDSIFKDRKILHNVADRDILKEAFIDDPSIILVVNDRTISVYMKAFIPLERLEDPANKYSADRYEPVLAYEHTY